jgi:hypothetical protein
MKKKLTEKERKLRRKERRRRALKRCAKGNRKPVGYWRDHRKTSKSSREYKGLPWPKEAEWDEDEKAAVLEYLWNAEFTGHYKGYSNCRICGARNGYAERGDSKYNFPDGLAHYVEEHNVKLPRSFIEHALKWKKKHDRKNRAKASG